MVAEALSVMRNADVNVLPVYDGGRFIGKITYIELTDFINCKQNTEDISAHKVNFDIATAMLTIKRANATDIDNKKKRVNPARHLFTGLSSVAAAALLLLGLTWMFFKPAPITGNVKNKIATPSVNQITLTLANGKKVILDGAKTGLIIKDSKWSYSDGSVIDNLNAEVNQQMILNVPRGYVYRVMLPDGSKVWLNASSSLKFPATFEGTPKRSVELHGEGYFEIEKVMLKSQDGIQKMPFVVVTDQQEIEVLGTHFNVSAYPNDGNVKTTLVEGSVRVKPFLQGDKLLSALDPSSSDPLKVGLGKAYGKAVLLKPNQQAILTGSDISVKAVDANEAFAWTDGEYIFRNTPLDVIMGTVTRWYDVEVVYHKKIARTVLLGGSISKSTTLSETLKMLELTANVHFKIEGRQVTVVK